MPQEPYPQSPKTLSSEGGATAAAGAGHQDLAVRPVREVRKFQHNARNQLNLIFGYVDLLGEASSGPLNATQQTYLETIRSAAASLDGMIDDLLPQPDTTAEGSG